MRLTRRALLAGLGGTALAAPAHGGEPEVVVIGAGAAGLAASATLQAAGRRVVVLEAMDRIGGRAFTDTRTFGVPFDVGCAWLHAADRNPWTAYARAHGFDLRPHEYDLEQVWLGPRPADAAVVNAAEAAMSEAISAAPSDVAASLVADVSTPVGEAAGDYLGALDMAVDLDELSTFDYAAAEDLSPNLLCAEGFGAIVAHRGRGLPVRLSTPVRAVRWDGPGVTVVTDRGDLRARAAVVTVSTGVLAGGGLRFTPDLPLAHQQAIADLPMGMLAKIPLLMNRRLGPGPFTDLLLARRGRRDLYVLCHPFDSDLMIGFVGGDLGWELSAAGEAAAVDFAVQGLVEMFGSAARGAVVRGGLTPWASNPWTRGAYAAASPGRFAARAALAEPVGDRLFFAGEALAGGLIQTCGGAWLSGRAAALEAVERLAA